MKTTSIGYIISFSKWSILILTLAAIIGLFGCNSCSKPDTGSLAGVVNLDNDTADLSLDPVDFSGVSMALYRTVELDTTLIRLNSEFPYIGVMPHQELEFDPDFTAPLLSTVSDAAGSFRFNKVPFGSYVLVGSKDGWGTVYRYNVHVGENNDTRDVNLTLYPVVVLAAVIQSPYIFKQDHSYRALTDVTIVNGCTFLGNSHILLAPSVQISVYGNITSDVSSGYTHFSPLNSESRLDRYDRWNTVKIFSDNQTVQNIVCWGANTGISLLGNDCTVSTSYIRDSNNGVYAGATRTSIFNCTFNSLSSRAIIYDQAESSTVINHVLENNIIYKCLDGLRTQGQAIRIKNNYFIDNSNAIQSFTYFNHIIENNNFDRNENAIICAGTRIPIQFNNFFANPESIFLTTAWYGGITQPMINYNNFYQSTGYAVKVKPLMEQSDDFDATMNYWKTDDIDAIIYDNLDSPPVYQTVVYLPKRSQTVAGCGVQPNQ